MKPCEVAGWAGLFIGWVLGTLNVSLLMRWLQGCWPWQAERRKP